MFFRSEAEQAFNVDTIESPVMDTVIKKCAAVYSGEPLWKDVKNGIRTINFAKSLSSETARLATLAIKITIEGSARAMDFIDMIQAYPLLQAINSQKPKSYIYARRMCICTPM